MAIGDKVYTIQIENVAVSAVQDIFGIKAGTVKGLELRTIVLGAIGQASATEFRLSIKRLPATMTVGSGGSTPTVQKVSSLNPTASSVSSAHANDTTQATTSGTAATLASFTWDVLLPFEMSQGPEVSDRFECDVSEGLVLTLNAAPSSTSISGYIQWAEK